MKKIFFPLIFLFFHSSPVFSETWITLTQFYEKDSYYKRLIDVRSIVKNGFRRYANMKYIKDGSSGTIYGITINCKEGIFNFENTMISKRVSKNNWIYVDSMGMNNKASAWTREAEDSFKFLCKDWK